MGARKNGAKAGLGTARAIGIDRAEQCSKTGPTGIQGGENILEDTHKKKWGLNRGGQSQQGNRTTELRGN